MNALTPLPTFYGGARFRSRLEARWAVFFDSVGAEWEYEPEGYNLDGVCYLPDFWLPASQMFVEVKSVAPGHEERLKAARLSAATGSPVIVVVGLPKPRSDASAAILAWLSGTIVVPAILSYCEPCARLQVHDQWGRCGCQRATESMHHKLVRSADLAASHRFDTPDRVSSILTTYDRTAMRVAIEGAGLGPDALDDMLAASGFDTGCQAVRRAILDHCAVPRTECP